MDNDFKQLIAKLNDSVLIDKLLQGMHISWEESMQPDLNHIKLGPKREELTKVIPMTIVYSIIFFTGIIGNVCTCIVIAKAKYMRTTTNIYLFNLAVADLLVLILGLPFEIYTFWSAYPWIFGEAFCYLRNMASETTTCASVLTITAFTIERYMAFCHPTKAPSISNLTRVTKILVVIWFLSGLLAIPLTVQFGIVYVKDEKNKSIKESAQCTLKQIDHSSPLFGISAFLFFILPMTIISVMYVCIALAIRRSTLQRSLSDRSANRKGYPTCFPGDRQSQARKAVVKMLVAVVVAFFICWAPFHIQRLMVFYVKEWTIKLRRVEKIIFYISGICTTSARQSILYCTT
ncbi:pyrokinin-1 receptor-like [Octopus sinensis]|uniref:Pyrokinin-1 receptor-like n=1 Tax=Octopus sinensis TaxID=2607531 RepID=A0A6P7SZU7_9MOLL|nr:pyrokinin-1 receptor-like [Octopus sinensis]